MANLTPVWPTEWLTPDCNTDPSDESPSQLDIISDIVGDGDTPAVYYAEDENYLFLRERVEGDPTCSGGSGMFTQHNWVVVCEQTGDNYYDYLFSLNGKDEKVQIWKNDPQAAEIDWYPSIFNDPAEIPIWNGSTSVYARIDTNGSYWFVSWAIPKSYGNFTLNSSRTLYFSTSGNANNYNKDHLDCYEEPYCGDGVVLDPEQCEYPDTYNNTYCSQTTQECLGAKLGTRDAYGDCNPYCGCAYDLFMYQCVEGECGATCDEDVDCQNKCEGNVYYYNGNCDLVSTCSCSWATEDCDDGNECTYDYCDSVTGCSNPPKPYGTECGEWRDCFDDICVDWFAYFYPDDGHDYCDGSGLCLIYLCDLEDSYCTDDDPGDGVNDLTCGAPCDQDEDCPQDTEKCDYVNKLYCTRDGYGTCDGDCECVEDEWDCNEEDYCLNCAHCGDGVVNCGEECEPGDIGERCLSEGVTIYYCINQTSYETPEFDSCNDICEWGDCEKIVTEDDDRCEPLSPPVCSWCSGGGFTFNRPSFNYQTPSYSYGTPSFSYSRPSFNFPSFDFSSFRR